MTGMHKAMECHCKEEALLAMIAYKESGLGYIELNCTKMILSMFFSFGLVGSDMDDVSEVLYHSGFSGSLIMVDLAVRASPLFFMC